MRTITNFLINTLTIALFVSAIAATNAAAATFTVNQTANAGDFTCDATCTLRDAVDDSNNLAGSDTIVFDPAVFGTPQTITLANAIFVSPATGESLTITGPGANLLTIRGNGAADSTGQIFNRNPNTSHALLLSGMTLTNAGFSAVPNNFTGAQTSLTVTNVAFVSNSSFAGGAINSSAPLTVTGCTFTNNTANGGGATGNGGGAIFSLGAGAVITITDSTFTGNTQTAGDGPSGGAIRNREGTMTITNSTFTNNTSRNGGGAISNGDILNISGSTFTGNSTTFGDASGGAVSSFTSGQLTITNSLITGSSALGDGGGIFAGFSGTTTITNTTISNNTANSDNNTTGEGGGLYFRGDAGAVTISNSTISGNQALGTAGNGGGIDVSSAMNMTNSTVSGNTAGRNGGGIRATGGIVNITSSTIVNNTAAMDGGGVNRNFNGSSNPINFRNTIVANNTAATAPDISGSVVSQGFNLIRTTTGATITGDTTSNITGLDPVLGPLQNNGGPTQTHALMVSSPAVDKGNSFGLTTDQRGMMRPSDLPNANYPNATGGDGADIGAYEIQLATAATVTVSGRVMAGRSGIARATVLMTDQSGQTRTMKTDSLGRFTFAEVRAGETYIFNVYARRYQFDPQVVTVTEDLDNLNFRAQR